MEIIGFMLALVMGIVLGLIGGGGSILTVPILIYIFQIDTVLATAYSLFIVGVSSLVGSISHIRQNNVDVKTALIFGIPSIVSVFCTRYFLMPMIPNQLFVAFGVIITKDFLLLLLFALLMLFAAYSMIKPSKKYNINETNTTQTYNIPLIFGEGTIVGILTGLVGAGGGFLIIPALVFFANLDMKKAVGTSLVIITMKSLIGFVGDIKNLNNIDWQFLTNFTLIAIVGILIGTYLSKKISDEKLKPSFGYFVMLMGVYIVIKECFLGN